MTLLGEFVLPNGGSAWTQTLVAALEAHGIRDKAARQELSRTEARGWLRRERVGRLTRWSLTDASVDVLSVGAERIYQFGQSPRSWDGRWVLLLASVPDSDRAGRYRMSQRLGWSGFGSLGHGVWISPWTDTEHLVVNALDSIDISATTFLGQVGELGSAKGLADRAWDLEALRRNYADFLSAVEIGRQSADEATHAAQLLNLVHRWRRFPLQDPDLPTELLPLDWPGPAAAELFAEARETLLPKSIRWWKELEERHAPADWPQRT